MIVNIAWSDIAMIRNGLVFILLIIAATFVTFNRKILIVREKMDMFYKGIETSSISYLIDEQVVLVFNYDFIEMFAQTTFYGYQVTIEKECESAFNIKVLVKEKFFNKEINEKIYLRKGDMYD